MAAGIQRLEQQAEHRRAHVAQCQIEFEKENTKRYPVDPNDEVIGCDALSALSGVATTVSSCAFTDGADAFHDCRATNRRLHCSNEPFPSRLSRL